MAEDDDDDHTDYWTVRFDAARAVGLTKLESKRFADGTTTLKTLRELKANGCASVTISRIVC